MNVSEKNILIIEYGNFFKLYLTIDFKKKDNFWILESKKFKTKMKSTNNNIDEARKEFVEIISESLKVLINDGTIFSVFEYLNIKQKPESQIIKEKIEEINGKKNEVKINNKELMMESFININRAEINCNWK